MDPLIIGLVAGSAVLHVAWNVRIKTAGDPLHAATIGQLAAALVIVPLGAVAWWAGGARPLPPEGIALGLVSGVVEAGYFVLLSAAYRRGDLSVVYPIARGTAPLVAVAIGVVILGERLGVGGSAGVVALLAGFLWHQRPWRVIAALSRRQSGDTAIAFAVATGLSIATYSAIDRVGSRLIDPIPYAAILWLVCSACLVAWTALVGSGGLRTVERAGARSAAIGGWLSLAAYVAILFALSVSPLTAVAPLRESSIVLASAWGAIRLGETSDRGEAARRIAASGLIVSGAVLLAVG